MELYIKMQWKNGIGQNGTRRKKKEGKKWGTRS